MALDNLTENPSETEKTKPISVRTWDDGTRIAAIAERQKPKSVWSSPKSMRSLGEPDLVETHFSLPDMPTIGELLEFDGKHFQVTDPRFPYLKDQFGNNSAFVRPLSEAEYQKLVSEKQS
jgi:hypothetical protein